MKNLRILLFARLREELGLGACKLQASDAKTVDDVRNALVKEHGEQWRSVLGEDNILVAVNQELVEWHQPVSDGDEVAFFPPVTGG